ncbi:MIP-related peptides-like [Mya arenaria]|uniref:MIP-related peptides-like n=1 Tax=Mya arenaria TaxID=6604 RepID=UPI0022DFC183|nr:MIP-related peptides-like [Mya arenaria]
MALSHTSFLAVSLLLVVSIQQTLQTGTDDAKAQAATKSSSGDSSKADSDANDLSASSDVIRLVRRYVPRFVGKREQEPLEILNETPDSKINFDDDDGELDMSVTEYFNRLDDSEKGEFLKDVRDAFDNAFIDDLYDAEGVSDNVDSEEGDTNSVETQEDAEGLPNSIDKRFRTYYGGRQYNPMFVGKRYRPMFVGKRYRPMFVGKRYRPMFVGKRYRPMFVGKRYRPMFVGKRYQPMFVGKRYTPQFVGKRYTPRFVGKRDTSEAAEKSAMEKRSVLLTNVDEELKNEDASSRKKRSVEDLDEEMQRRAWGRYVPWKTAPLASAPVTKRFVAPEFIGRRDSLSSILSALDALDLARNPLRSTSKRFEAPMFIGKRVPRPMFVGKRNQYTSEMSVDSRFPLEYSGLDSIGSASDGYAYQPQVLDDYNSPQYTISHY